LESTTVNRIERDQNRACVEQKKQQLYLFSLNWIQESNPEYFQKKDVRRLWEWKDTTLGDGRDFFVPKPKTLMALQQYLLKNIPSLMECSIISNCARLEVLCSCSCIPSPTTDNGELAKADGNQKQLLAHGLSNCFITQTDHQKILSKNRNIWAKFLTQFPVNVDNPKSILTMEPPVIDPLKPISYYDSWWNVTMGSEAILTHICQVAAGMASRPRRPSRPVIFRPFSSRDAHILLQLKRTRENISIRPYECTSKSIITESESECGMQQQQNRKILPLVLDYALRAGKAARNPNIVPEILELREFTSAESSIGSPSEQRRNERIALVANEKGIYPLVMECVIKLNDSNLNIDQQIAEFRQNAFELLREIEMNAAASDDETAEDHGKTLRQELRLWLNRRLHEPTVQLRSLSRQQNNSDGDNIGADDFTQNSLREIRNELQEEFICRRERIRLENRIVLK